MSTTVKAAANLIAKSAIIYLSTSLQLPSTLSWAQPTDTQSQTGLARFGHCWPNTSLWVPPQGQLQVTRLKQVQAPLGAEGWDGAKPWVLWALCRGLLLWNKCHFLLAWAWFLFAVSCLANRSQTFCHPAFHAEWGYHGQKGAFFLETLSHSTHPTFLTPAKHPWSPLPTPLGRDQSNPTFPG